MFKNVTIYRIAPGWDVTLEAMEAALDAARFMPCGASQDKSVGWVEPRGEPHGPLVESVAGQRILKLMIETKSVPGSVVREKAQEEADHIEAATGRKPGKKETKALREDALLALLPQAFPRRGATWVWIDLANGWLVTDASSQGKLDELVTALVNAFNDLSVTLLQTQVTPQTAMTQWLSATSPEEMKPSSCMRSKTWSRAFFARSGQRRGSRLFGLLMMPVMVALSSIVSCFTSLPK